MGEQQTITEDEAALYDRQIRLWGLDAQRRLRASRVLLIGMRGLGAEVAKNIVLSGIKSLTMLDDTEVTEEDSCSQFLLPRSDVGKNRAVCSLERTQQLNPMVTVTADSGRVADKDSDFFTQFDVVCATCCGPSQLERINKICADNGIKFYAGDVFGYYGYMFSDLGDHEYAEEIPKKPAKKEEGGDGEPAAKKSKSEEPETVVVKKEVVTWRVNVTGPMIKERALKFVEDLKNDTFLSCLMEIDDLIANEFFFRFMEKFGRRPAVKSHDHDVEKLTALRSETMEDLKVGTKTVPEDFTSHCFSELSPVCAVVGGILGQEIIKAVSHKDKPHNNFFFYNGVEGSGLVDQIGAATS
ncbi:SUMO-activating enzyme subunit 1-like [Ylistrum balloti]|uniref:SUMO-activating enzyme subunit 1-like n=1 Tax=Ylistrum balloti TaxID=509963 RepID=UPI002905B971|nr:SUMO-activating enzyme subunit 1-like [Ylistrum balloti]